MMIPPIQENALEQLLELSTAVHGLVITMINLQFEGHLTNPQLLSDLTDKLTPYLRFMWGQELAKWNQRGDLNKFAEWLNRQANAIILVERSIPIKVDSKPKEKVKSPVNKRRSSTTVLTVSGSKKSSPYDRCKACKRTGHELEKCRKFLDLDVDEKWELVIGSKLCFVCLKPDHRVPNCEDREECGEDGCTSLHHKLLHNPNRMRKRSEVHTTTHTTVDESEPKEVLLKILPVQVSGPKGSVQTYALLDEGSTVTLMSEETANKIGVKGKVESLTLNWTDGRTKQKVAAKIVDVKIKGKQGRNHQMNGVKVIKDLNLPLQTVSIKMAEKLGSHVSAKDLVFRSAKPTILIGQDNCHLIISREIVSAGKNGPIASRTDLGWVLHGLINDTNNEEATVLFINQVRDDDLNETVKDYFKIDSLGIKITDPPESEANKKARAIVQATAKRREDFHWEVGLPWKNDQINDDQASYLTAVKRLEIQEKKFQKDPEYAQEYKKKIDDFLEKGYAEKVAEDQDPGKRVCYLPHFGVINKNKPVKKLRLVFDAAAKSDGCSLNDLLLTGPDLLTSLVGTLFSFRSRSVAVCGDIREMFLQIGIREEDRDAFRFLWRPTKDEDVEIYRMKALIFGATCSPFIAQEIKDRNAEEFRSQYPDAYDVITRHHYMDDCLTSKNSYKEAIKIIKDVTQVHQAGGFEIRGWISNSPKVLQAITPADQDPNEVRPEKTKTFADEKVLGIMWNTESDELSFTCSIDRVKQELSTRKTRPTKREVLKILMSIYDPLGLITPFTTRGKIILQDIWRQGIGWDDELTESTFQKWKDWIQCINEIRNLRIPRCYAFNAGEDDHRQLHVFVDASEQAYAAVAYLRTETREEIRCTIVIAKSKVAPLKPLSIPRLELQAATVGSRLSTLIQKEHDLKIDRTFFWSDSRTVLSWIRSDARRYKQFVSVRIGEILETTNIEDWRWVPTGENVADDATRNCSSQKDEERWIHGPPFLYLPENSWPQENVGSNFVEDEAELKREYVGFVSESDERYLPDVNRFSSMMKLLRSTAWILRYVRNCRAKVKKQPLLRRDLTVAEIRDAENLWIRQVQLESFGAEIKSLKVKGTVPKDSKLYKLTPELASDEIIRLRGRTNNSESLKESTKKPAILDPDHPFTALIIKHYHVICGHQGHETVMNEVRQRYWVLKLRTTVKKLWKLCNFCKIRNAKPQVPQMGSLPEQRVTVQSRPFAVTGLDFFGPLYVTVKRSIEKRYGALFVCMATRAIHIELASSLRTDSAIMAMRRMMSRRGFCEEIISDNGTNFRGASEELKKALQELDQERIKVELAVRGVDWRFNPPAAPHMGGSWERLVRSVKSTLKVILKEQHPREETLLTTLAEVENIVNS